MGGIVVFSYTLVLGPNGSFDMSFTTSPDMGSGLVFSGQYTIDGGSITFNPTGGSASFTVQMDDTPGSQTISGTFPNSLTSGIGNPLSLTFTKEID
jgi:hypothetical protein